MKSATWKLRQQPKKWKSIQLRLEQRSSGGIWMQSSRAIHITTHFDKTGFDDYKFRKTILKNQT
jgi:hypothetical protein